MQFTKTLLVAFLSMASFAAALPSGDSQSSGIEQRDAAPEDLFRRMGGNGKCSKHGHEMKCKKNNGGRPPVMTICGACRADATPGEDCLCDA